MINQLALVGFDFWFQTLAILLVGSFSFTTLLMLITSTRQSKEICPEQGLGYRCKRERGQTCKHKLKENKK